MSVSGSWVRAARGAMLLSDDGELRPTIFAEMSALAARTGAINLGQGYPDEDGPRAVLEAAKRAIDEGLNQYPPGRGMPVLLEAIANHQQRFYGLRVDPEREVLVTTGATEAIAATLLALVDAGDEVVTFEPFYDSYAAMIALAGGVHVTVALPAPAFRPDLDRLRAAVTDRTRVILINSPHNPTGTVLDREALELIVELAHRHDAIIVTDEVYEHLVFGVEHIPISTLPGARERTVTISSGGKTFSTTGWKIGWLIAPPELLDAILAVKQFLSYVSGAPFQPAIATGLGLPDSYFADAAAALAVKRELLGSGLRRAGFEVSRPDGSYFIIADAAPLGFIDAVEFCRRLPQLAGVAGIPLTAFVRPERHADYRSLVRFAFCKRAEVLDRASAQLAQLRRT
ncbi:aminotransferase class I/II-fold pyridoxal phosphate-dependent enzyme [Lysinimonas soli]|uniref:Aminotransferase class I/II-fold pyridoxal phosphate-dependent enzyme n=1 Tax=Lysinimonas soli TaxID=1074233 RepID=A0ABW0NN84_9MICO